MEMESFYDYLTRTAGPDGPTRHRLTVVLECDPYGGTRLGNQWTYTARDDDRLSPQIEARREVPKALVGDIETLFVTLATAVEQFENETELAKLRGQVQELEAKLRKDAEPA